jgi:hypothetical protein
MMKPNPFLSILPLLGSALILCACANQGQSYASKHPELSPEHRKILMSGRIPDGSAVAGMTREQVRLAMGVDPAQFTKIDDMDAWVFVKQQGKYAEPEAQQGHFYENGPTGSSGSWVDHEPSSSSMDSTIPKGTMHTTVVFRGDRAVRANVSMERTPE